jgi:predicted 2-oxoglutarate/Fe(II)-dependent dioxygenase YbiX
LAYFQFAQGYIYILPVNLIRLKSNAALYGYNIFRLSQAMINSIASGIYTIDDVFTAAECSSYIAESENLGYSAATLETRKGPVLDQTVRNNSRVIRDDQALAAILWRRVREHLPAFIDGCQAIGVNERFRFYRYEPSQYFAGHTDGSFRRDNGEESRLTLMVYLNDDCTGGETAFSDVIVTPRQGMALVFRHELFHEGRPIKSGRKYVLRSDIMFGPAGRLRG